MKFETVGEPESPVIVLMCGSFMTGQGMMGIAERLADDYRVICPTYDGHYPGGGTFDSRESQAQGVVRHLEREGIEAVRVIGGVSMGAEVVLDLAAMVEGQPAPSVNVGRYLLDGGPFFRFPALMRWVMRRKFLGMVRMGRERPAEDMLRNPFVSWVIHGDVEPYRALMGGIAFDCLSDETVRNESDACYTFDFPELSVEAQRKLLFSWSSNEPARQSAKKVRACYPHATYRDAGELGHCGFMLKEPDRYAELVRQLACAATSRN